MNGAVQTRGLELREKGMRAREGGRVCSAPLLAECSNDRDLHAYSPVSRAWSDLSSPSSGSPPRARTEHAMTDSMQ
eukprot:490903-Rhodomonas_salina.2